MPYPSLPDRSIPYDLDGTVVATSGGQANPVSGYLTSGQVAALVEVSNIGGSGIQGPGAATWLTFFFIEQKNISNLYIIMWKLDTNQTAILTPRASNTTTNGVDGTWETASMASQSYDTSPTGWRNSGWKPLSFSTAYSTFQCGYPGALGGTFYWVVIVYGKKGTGQTPDDIIFLDGDASFTEYTTDKDFGDRPLGTTVVKQFQIKNTSATKTANTVTIQCNDTDFNIGTTSSGPWTTSISLASLAAGASSATYFIKNTTPAPGAALGPREARLIVTVGSFT